MKNRRVALFAVVSVVLSVCVVACCGNSDEGSRREPPGAPGVPGEIESVPDEPALDVESAEWVRGEYGTRYISGIVRNNTDHRYSYVQVTIPLYDEAGNQVGSALDNINNLNPGSTWKFEAIVIEGGSLTFSPSEVEVSGW